jgi:hypothetical protein
VPTASPYSSKLGILSTEIEVEFRKYPDGALILAWRLAQVLEPL